MAHAQVLDTNEIRQNIVDRYASMALQSMSLPLEDTFRTTLIIVRILRPVLSLNTLKTAPTGKAS